MHLLKENTGYEYQQEFRRVKEKMTPDKRLELQNDLEGAR